MKKVVTHYTTEEGGEVKTLPIEGCRIMESLLRDKRGTFNPRDPSKTVELSFESPNGATLVLKAHSLFFEDGTVWDAVNGMRETSNPNP